MRKMLFNILNKVYGYLMFTSFFAGVLPLLPFIVAICIGGKTGEAISVFLYKEYYPWVILVGSLALIIGLVAMYLGKLEGLSVKKAIAEEKDEETK